MKFQDTCWQYLQTGIAFHPRHSATTALPLWWMKRMLLLQRINVVLRHDLRTHGWLVMMNHRHQSPQYQVTPATTAAAYSPTLCPNTSQGNPSSCSNMLELLPHTTPGFESRIVWILGSSDHESAVQQSNNGVSQSKV